MKKHADISNLDLLEQVTLPMGNLSWSLEALLDQGLAMDSETMKHGLRNIQENAEAIYQFLLNIDEKPTSVVGRRTPEVLRRFIAEKRRTGQIISITGRQHANE